MIIDCFYCLNQTESPELNDDEGWASFVKTNHWVLGFWAKDIEGEFFVNHPVCPKCAKKHLRLRNDTKRKNEP